MDNNLKQLIELQKIDSRLLSIEELRGDLPNIVDNLGKELKTTKEFALVLTLLLILIKDF